MSYVPDPSVMRPYTGWGSSNQAYSNNLKFRNSTLYVPDFSAEIAYLQAEIDAITQNPIDIGPFSAIPDAKGLSETHTPHRTDIFMHAASVSTPGGVSTTTQEFAGVKTLTSPVIKGIHGTTLVDRYVTVDENGILGTDVGGGGADPLPIFSQTVWVNKGGNDLTGDGTESAPYLTIATAIASVTDATIIKVYAVNIGPGIYAESINIKPNMFLIGAGSQLTRLDGVLGTDTIEWIYTIPTFFGNWVRTGVIGMNLNNPSGTRNEINMLRHDSRQSLFTIENCESFIGYRYTPRSTWDSQSIFRIRGGLSEGVLNLSGGKIILENTTFEYIEVANVISNHMLLNLQNVKCGQVDITSGAVFTRVVIVGGSILEGFSNGSDNRVSTTVGSLRNFTFSGGAYHIPYSKAQYLGYAPTVPANWATTPTQVAQALDLLANAGTALTVAPPIVAFDANGVTIDMNDQLIMQIADATYPGIVTAVDQTFGGLKTFPGGISLNNTRMIANTGQRFMTTNVSGNSIFVGNQAGNDIAVGEQNTSIGGLTGPNITTGARNVFVGYEAGRVSSSGSDSCYVGYRAGYRATTGSSNTCIGHEAGESILTTAQNTLVGDSAGLVMTGAGNTCLGYNAGYLVGVGDNNICIANDGLVGDVAVTRIGRGGTALEAYVAGIYGTAPSVSIDQQICMVGSDHKLSSGGLTRFTYGNYSGTLRRTNGTITSAQLNGAPAVLDLDGAITMGPTIIGQIVGKMMTLSFPLVTVTGQSGTSTQEWDIVNISPALPTMVSSSVTTSTLFNNSTVVPSGYIFVSAAGTRISFHVPANLNLNWGMADGRCQITFPVV